MTSGKAPLSAIGMPALTRAWGECQYKPNIARGDYVVNAQTELPFGLPASDSCDCAKLSRVRNLRAQRQRAVGKGKYPLNWLGVANKVKESAGWRCECCRHPRKKRNAKDACDALCVHPDDGKKRSLAVHHLDMRPENCEWWNLVALCDSCHMRVQGRLDWAQMSLSDANSAWGESLPRWLAVRRKGFLETLTDRDIAPRVPLRAAASDIRPVVQTARTPRLEGAKPPEGAGAFGSQPRLPLM